MRSWEEETSESKESSGEENFPEGWQSRPVDTLNSITFSLPFNFRWPPFDLGNLYHLEAASYGLERMVVSFPPLDHASPCGVPMNLCLFFVDPVVYIITLQEWKDLWAAWDILHQRLKFLFCIGHISILSNQY